MTISEFSQNVGIFGGLEKDNTYCLERNMIA